MIHVYANVWAPSYKIHTFGYSRSDIHITVSTHISCTYSSNFANPKTLTRSRNNVEKINKKVFQLSIRYVKHFFSTTVKLSNSLPMATCIQSQQFIPLDMLQLYHHCNSLTTHLNSPFFFRCCLSLEIHLSKYLSGGHLTSALFRKCCYLPLFVSARFCHFIYSTCTVLCFQFSSLFFSYVIRCNYGYVWPCCVWNRLQNKLFIYQLFSHLVKFLPRNNLPSGVSKEEDEKYFLKKC